MIIAYLLDRIFLAVLQDALQESPGYPDVVQSLHRLIGLIQNVFLTKCAHLDIPPHYRANGQNVPHIINRLWLLIHLLLTHPGTTSASLVLIP